MTATARATPKPVAVREITVSRTFAAPRALVFSMFTDAKHLAAWWGPHGFTNPVCEADAREGGRILIHMRAPDGNVHPMGGIFHEIKPHDRIVFTSFVDMPDGKRVLEGLNTVTFEEQRGRTRVTVHARAEGYRRLRRTDARRHGGRLVAEPRQARRATPCARPARRMRTIRSRSARSSATAPTRCSARASISR